jgi:SdpC family antimicrobial peptide
MRKLQAIVTSVVVAGAVVAAGIFGVSSASAAPANLSPVNAKSANPLNSHVTPESLFHGVYFLQGPIGKKIYSGTSVEQLSNFSEVISALNAPKATSLASAIIADIRSTNPGFLTRWADQIQSGNPYTVGQALSEGRNLIAQTATLKNSVAATSTYVPGQVGADCFFNVLVGALFVIAAGAFVVVLVVGIEAGAVGYNVALAQNVVSTGHAIGPTDTRAQEWNAQITSRLAR